MVLLPSVGESRYTHSFWLALSSAQQRTLTDLAVFAGRHCVVFISGTTAVNPANPTAAHVSEDHTNLTSMLHPVPRVTCCWSSTAVHSRAPFAAQMPAAAVWVVLVWQVGFAAGVAFRSDSPHTAFCTA